MNWVFCQSFIVKPIWKYMNIQVLMTLKARKDFMVFKQRDLLWSGTYCSWLFVRSKLCLPLQRKTRSLCHCFVIFENCTCQQVNKAKHIGDKQRSPWSYPLLTACARSDKENFLIHGELTETNKSLVFRSELSSNLNFRRFLINSWCLSLKNSIQKD